MVTPFLSEWIGDSPSGGKLVMTSAPKTTADLTMPVGGDPLVQAQVDLRSSYWPR
jgi:hypothetical protein